MGEVFRTRAARGPRRWREPRKPFPRTSAEAQLAIAQSALLAGEPCRRPGRDDVAIGKAPAGPPAAILKAECCARDSAQEAAEKSLQALLSRYPAATEAAPSPNARPAKKLGGSRAIYRRASNFRLAAPRPSRTIPSCLWPRPLLFPTADRVENCHRRGRGISPGVLDLKPRDVIPLYPFQSRYRRRVSQVNMDGATSCYRRFNESDYFGAPAQLKIATLIAKRDEPARARKFLSEARHVERPNARRTRVFSWSWAEVQLLREAKA